MVDYQAAAGRKAMAAQLIKAKADKRTIAALRGAFNAWLAKGSLGQELRICVDGGDGVEFSVGITTVLGSSPELIATQDSLPKAARIVGARLVSRCLEDLRALEEGEQ